ncbi:hypothetical protein GGX14DRAFT_561907 [Mycena pura]|uniref:Uncharacterized protein n=1 Tax=Mycena pura TaxID=153505 RepID=A0AAD6VUC0_9AGAR|nr:hypothetical protein GGX14DRAFT_561907 [Mycena pura]
MSSNNAYLHISSDCVRLLPCLAFFLFTPLPARTELTCDSETLPRVVPSMHYAGVAHTVRLTVRQLYESVRVPPQDCVHATEAMEKISLVVEEDLKGDTVVVFTVGEKMVYTYHLAHDAAPLCHAEINPAVGRAPHTMPPRMIPENKMLWGIIVYIPSRWIACTCCVLTPAHDQLCSDPVETGTPAHTRNGPRARSHLHRPRPHLQPRPCPRLHPHRPRPCPCPRTRTPATAPDARTGNPSRPRPHPQRRHPRLPHTRDPRPRRDTPRPRLRLQPRPRRRLQPHPPAPAARGQ